MESKKPPLKYFNLRHNKRDEREGEKRLLPRPIAMSPANSSSFLFPFLFLFLLFSASAPSLAQQQNFSSFSLKQSPWTPSQNLLLRSPNSIFAAGFRPRRNDPNLFLFSVWFFNISRSAVVWSANRNVPVSASGALVITPTGELQLNDGFGRKVWPSVNISGEPDSDQLVLKNDGNLVFSNWESFQNPTNTILPNQTIKGTTIISNNRKFTLVNSSKLIFNYSDIYWGTNNAFLLLSENGKLAQENGDSTITSDLGAIRQRKLVLDNDGNLRIYSYDPNLLQWSSVWQAVLEICTIHGTCGPNAICVNNDYNSTNCVCPPGYRPRDGGAEEGCERKSPLTEISKFLRLDYVNFTGGSNQTNQNVRNFSTCEALCLAQPNCVGFLFRFSGNGFCVLQLERMIFGYWSPGTQIVMFLRVAQSETDQSNFTGLTNLLETRCPVRISIPLPPSEINTTARNIAIICALLAAELISGALFFSAFLKRFVKYRDMARSLGLESLPAGGIKRYTYGELKSATNDFSVPIGRGGFGDVFKGELPDKRVIAVKCLKRVTGGDAEFWAEVTIIARMHHLNLVRLWGFCAEKGQRILVYEYVPNGSLDKYLFTSSRTKDLEAEDRRIPILDWSVRFRIALGVARSIAYLHEECLEWVLHCDIKPENILLGDDFCPKISDFGLAKLRKKEDMVSMSRIRGTRGYMAPEWVKMDPITPKADVWSFGMVLLEMVTGTRNFEMQGSKMESEDWYFPSWAFEKVFKEMRVEDILDHHMKHCYDSRVHYDLVNRMVQTAMWCLQDRPEMRPSMGKVAKMLEGTVEITEPKKPTIFYLSQE